MFESIQEIEDKYVIKFKSVELSNEILSIFNSGELNVELFDLTNSEILCIIGLYYQYVKEDYEEMKKYYLLAIEKGNVNAMFNLAIHYDNTQNYEQMKKYYLMAIEKDDSDAMFEMGEYYQYVEIDNDKMNKYYLMAIEKGNEDAICNLKYYYEDNILGLYDLLVSSENRNKFINTML
jgi:TPR repeat protein